MTAATLYGIGVGPGDPEWITVQAARILAACRCVYAPRSAAAADSVALEIAASLPASPTPSSTSSLFP